MSEMPGNTEAYQHKFVVYDLATGRIRKQGSTSLLTDVDLQARPGMGVIEHDLDSTDIASEYHVVGGMLVERPALAFDKTAIAANGVDEAVVSSLPNPTTVLVDGSPHVVTDGSFELSTTMPATYQVEIDVWPYLPLRVEIVAS